MDAEQLKAAKADYAKAKSKWIVAKQEWHVGVLVGKDELPTFQSISFGESDCVVSYKPERGAETCTSTFKIKISILKGLPAVFLLDDEGTVRFSMAYKSIDKNGLHIAISLDASIVSDGFDVKKNKIILLTCKKNKTKR